MTELLDTFISVSDLLKDRVMMTRTVCIFATLRMVGYFDAIRWGLLKPSFRNARDIGGIALHADGGIIVSGRDICHVKRGVSRTLLKLDGAARFNDIATDPSGRLYVGTLRFNPFNPDALPTPGELYRLEKEGKATKLYDDVGLTNGIGFSSDGRTIYHCDSLRRHIIAHDIKDDGNCTDRRIFAELPMGAPDGLCVDANGGVWVAAYNAGCILRFTPEGNPDRKIDIPAKKVTSLCFGDEDLRTLYVTSADNQTDEKRGGCVFRLRVDVAGLPHARVLI